MNEIAHYTLAKQFLDARIADAQHEMVVRQFRRRARREQRDNLRRTLAGVLHRVANRIDPARSFRLPAQRHPA